MTQNAADLLIAFFTSNNKSQYKFTPLWAAMSEIESNVDAWEALGQKVTHFRDAVRAAKAELRSSVNSEFECLLAAKNISSGDIGVLGWISERLSRTTPEFSDEQRDSIREMLGEAKKRVVADTKLPNDLRLHLARLIRHVEECLDDWHITGDFALADALDRLMGAMRIAEEKSTEPDKWKDLWTGWVQPIAVGLVASMPQVGLQIGQMFSIAS